MQSSSSTARHVSVQGEAHCSHKGCATIDFLPFVCEGCNRRFCKDHAQCADHDCPNPVIHDRIKLACPVCQQLLPCNRDDDPNRLVDLHISRGCQPVAKKKSMATPCSFSGCKAKELVPVNCKLCKKPFCIKHRLESDHNCVMTAQPSAAVREEEFKKRFSTKIKFSNTPETAKGDSKIAASDKLVLAVNAPQALAKAPLWCIVSSKWATGKAVDNLAKILKVPNKDERGVFMRMFDLRGNALEKMKPLSQANLSNGDTVVLEYGDTLPSDFKKKKVAVGKKGTGGKDKDCCIM